MGGLSSNRLVLSCPGLGNECRESVEKRREADQGLNGVLKKASDCAKVVASILQEQEGSCAVGPKQTATERKSTRQGTDGTAAQHVSGVLDAASLENIGKCACCT